MQLYQERMLELQNKSEAVTSIILEIYIKSSPLPSFDCTYLRILLGGVGSGHETQHPSLQEGDLVECQCVGHQLKLVATCIKTI